MIAIDTNVLLRYLLADDAQQYTKAKKLITNNNPVLITDVVLVEALWSLAGKRYTFDKTSLCHVVRGLFSDRAFIFENNQAVWSALCDYEEAKTVRGKHLDFADALIFRKSAHIAEAKKLKLAGFYSFDKALEQLHGTETPK